MCFCCSSRPRLSSYISTSSLSPSSPSCLAFNRDPILDPLTAAAFPRSRAPPPSASRAWGSTKYPRSPESRQSHTPTEKTVAARGRRGRGLEAPIIGRHCPTLAIMHPRIITKTHRAVRRLSAMSPPSSDPPRRVNVANCEPITGALKKRPQRVRQLALGSWRSRS